MSWSKTTLFYQQAALSDGRPLLLAIAPEASPNVRAAAAASMAEGVRIAMEGAYFLTSGIDPSDVLPYSGFNAMAFMVSPWCIPGVLSMPHAA